MSEIDLHSFVEAGLLDSNPDHIIPKTLVNFLLAKKLNKPIVLSDMINYL